MVDRGTSPNSWQEKYLNALDIQEASERHLALLRRMLVRISLSANGQDEAFDQTLDYMRGQLRSGDLDIAGLTALFNELDRAVAGFHQRQDSAKDIARSLVATVHPLQQRSLSRPLKKEISHYLSQVSKGSESIYLYPALLQQLVNIQQQALKELHQPVIGFWRKLMGINNTAVDAVTGQLAVTGTRLLEQECEPTMSLGSELQYLDASNKKLRLHCIRMTAL